MRIAIAALAAVLLPLFLAAGALADLNDGLVAYWPLLGGPQDASGNGHDGIVTGAALSENRCALPASAYEFDGADWIDVPDAPSLTLGSGSFTMAAWIRLSEFSSDGGYYLMGHSSGGGSTNKWIFFVGNTSIYFIQGPSLGWIYVGAAAFELGTWHHVALRRDGGALTGFLDAAPIGTVALPVAIPDPAGPLQIGSAEYAENHAGRRFRGVIDEVRIYSRSLSLDEISALADPAGLECTSAVEATTWGSIKRLYD